MDCWFETEAGITIVDFKTDRVSTQQAMEDRSQHYQGQMAAYAYALAAVTGKPVTRRILWFPLPGAGPLLAVSGKKMKKNEKKDLLFSKESGNI